MMTFTPLISNNLSNGAIWEEYFWFYGSMGIVCIATLIYSIIKKHLFHFSVSDGLILLFSFSIYLQTWPFFDISENISKFILLTLLLALYLCLRLILSAGIYRLRALIHLFILLTGLVEALWGIMQLYDIRPSQHNLFRITGSFSNPGPYACYLAMIFPMAFYYMLKACAYYKAKFHIRNIPVYLLWIISVLTVITIILILPATISRTAWIACSVGCMIIVLHSVSKNIKINTFIIANKKKCIFIFFLITLSIIIGCFGLYILKKDSASGRAFIWKNTIELIKQNPAGVGLGNFSGSYGHFQAAYFESGKGSEDEKRVAGNPEYAFNEYLQICAEQGIIVFFLFTYIVGYSLYIGIKRKKIASTSSLFALLIVASASYPFSVLPFLIVLVFLLALIHNGEKGIAIPKSVSVALAFCGLIIVSLCLYNRYPTYDAYKKWNKVKMLYSFGNNKDVATEYGRIYPLLSDQIQFLFEYAQCLNKSEQYEESNDVLKKAIKISCDPMLYNVMGKNFQALEQYDKAEQCFIKSSNIVPSRIYPYYLLTLMYVDAGEMDKAKDMAQIVLTKEPKVQSTAVKEMRNEVMKLFDQNKILEK